MLQQGNTALHLAATANNKDLVQLLIDSNAEVDLPNHVCTTFE